MLSGEEEEVCGIEKEIESTQDRTTHNDENNLMNQEEKLNIMNTKNTEDMQHSVNSDRSSSNQ